RDDFIPLTLPRFVEPTATGYFFAPSLTALQRISAEGSAAASIPTLAQAQPQGSQVKMPTTYSELGAFIDRHRPYGGSEGLADLTRASTQGTTPPKSGANGINDVDVFGALFRFGAGGDGEVPIQVVNRNGTHVVEPVNAPLEQEGIFHVMLPNGEEYRI